MALTQKTQDALVGRRIVGIMDGDGLHLDSGKTIYLSESEVEHLNDHYDPETDEQMEQREYKEYAENKTSYGQTPLTFEQWLHQDDIK